MKHETPFVARIDPAQEQEIEQVRWLRKSASDLRSLVSSGSYGTTELELFWRLTASAGIILRASNPELGKRAGLGDRFFSLMARDRRSPKLTNFLKALAVIIEVADERLFDVDKGNALLNDKSGQILTVQNLRIEQDLNQLMALARSLVKLARDEIEQIDDERPNDPTIIAERGRQRELLVIFADGFERISNALAELEQNLGEPILLGKANEVLNIVSNQVNSWWAKNGGDAVDWGLRIPVFAAGVAMLGWAGANMTVATSAIAAIVGGSKVIHSIRKRK